MNGRLAVLAEQAGYFIKFERTGSDVTVVHTKEPGTDGDLALFGELVVRECAKYINERTQDWDADLRWIFNDGSGDMAVNVDELLNRHFGVEE